MIGPQTPTSTWVMPMVTEQFLKHQEIDVSAPHVLINLVINGIEAMQMVTDRPRELKIRSRQEEAGQVLVAVEDCGVGPVE